MENEDIAAQVVVSRAYGALGELVPAFERVGRTTVMNRTGFGPVGRFPSYWNKISSSYKRNLIHQSKFHLAYLNSVPRADSIRVIQDLDCSILVHVHELDHYFRYSLNSDELNWFLTNPVRYIAASQAVQDLLLGEFHIPATKVHLAHGYLPIDNLMADRENWDRREIRRSLDIPAEALLVGGSGTLDMRKGADLFLLVATKVLSTFTERPVHFVWVGGLCEGDYFGWLDLHVKRAGISDNVHFGGHTDFPLDYFSALDVFLMCSREDPYPLVNLENALLGNPIVCFEAAGGSTEFVKPDAGIAIPFMDVQAMAEWVIELLRNPSLRHRLGQAGAKKVRERHSLDRAAAQIHEIILRTVEMQT